MTFDDYIGVIIGGTMADITASGSPRLQELLTRACNLFEAYDDRDQLISMACMVGMILGTLEGERVPAEQTLGVIITHHERLQQFDAQVRVVFWDAMAARGMPQNRVAPHWVLGPRIKPKKIKPVKGARVLAITSGKRKKKVIGHG